MDTSVPGPVQTFILHIQRQILEPLVTLIALAAFVLFLWGVFQYIRGAESDEKRKTGQQHMFWGIIGLAIIFGANAIISFIRATIGV